ncbi:MAG: beta-1,6-N-acetylglucosaminyltransferase [Thiotrichales bacterium]
MKLLYFIGAYAGTEIVSRQIERLGANGAQFVIHVDARRDDTFTELRARHGANPRVHFLEHRRKIFWGQPGYLFSILDSIHYAIEQRLDFDVATLLSDSCYPLRPISAIEDWFRAHPGKNFIDIAHRDKDPHVWSNWGPPSSMRTRMEHWHLMFHTRMVARIPLKRRLPLGHEPYVGWLWWSLTREAVTYLDEFFAANPRYIAFLKRTYSPDEFIFQTVLMNSPLRETLVNDNLRYLHPPTEEIPFTNFIREISEPDLPTVLASSALIARKVKTIALAETIDRLAPSATALTARNPDKRAAPLPSWSLPKAESLRKPRRVEA